MAVAGCQGEPPPPGGDGGGRHGAGSAPVWDPALEGGYLMGNPDAPVAVVEFSDFGCPYCGRFARTTLPLLVDEYIARGAVSWRYVPIVMGFPGGEVMARGAICAGERRGADGFWVAHDLLYARQVALREPDAGDRMVDWLAEHGFDAEALRDCIRSDRTTEQVRRNNGLAAGWYVRGTPTFVINGVPMSGAMPPDVFRKVFDHAILAVR